MFAGDISESRDTREWRDQAMVTHPVQAKIMINIETVEPSLGRRLHDLVERAHRSGRAQIDVATLEQWLQCWNDDDSVAGNLRNLEYWLATHSASAAATASQR
jgi:hypothetical protein